MPKHPLGFCGLPSNKTDYARASTVILPVPFDKTSTWQKGADKGPAAILEASANLEFYDIETDSEVFKKGIYTAKPIHAASSSALVRKTDSEVSRYLKDGKLVVTLGGEHSVSIGVIKSYARHYRDLSVLHLTPTQTLVTHQGSAYNHACVMARVRNLPRRLVSVGIRSMDTRSGLQLTKKDIFAHEIYNSDKLCSSLAHRYCVCHHRSRRFRSGIMPSGTPEPEGLGWYQVMQPFPGLQVETNRRIDVVELSIKPKAPDFPPPN
jgi:agmatinase